MTSITWTQGSVTVDAFALHRVLDLASDITQRTAEEQNALVDLYTAIGGVEAAMACAHVGMTHLDGERV